jgi:hypothetical protein
MTIRQESLQDVLDRMRMQVEHAPNETHMLVFKEDVVMLAAALHIAGEYITMLGVSPSELARGFEQIVAREESAEDGDTRD